MKNSNLAEDAPNTGLVIKDKALEIGTDIKNQAVDLSQAAFQKARDAQESIVTSVRNNPYKSLSLAFLSGFLLAKVLRLKG